MEPLSRSALRHRVARLLVLVLPRAGAGMGVDGALRLPAGDPPLRQPRRRSLRPPSRHPVRHAGRVSDVRRRVGSLGRVHGSRRRGVGAVPADGDRVPVHSEVAGGRRHRHVRRGDLPHGHLAARGCRPQGPARRRHRHRLVWHPGDPVDRRAGSRADRVPAHPGVLDSGAQRPARPGARRRPQGELPGVPRAGADDPHRRRVRHRRRQRHGSRPG